VVSVACTATLSEKESVFLIISDDAIKMIATANTINSGILNSEYKNNLSLAMRELALG